MNKDKISPQDRLKVEKYAAEFLSLTEEALSEAYSNLAMMERLKYPDHIVAAVRNAIHGLEDCCDYDEIKIRVASLEDFWRSENKRINTLNGIVE